jgi:hypothetical protein
VKLTAARWCVLILLAFPAPGASGSDESEADRIMARVAWNQNRAQTLRRAFRYRQEVRVRFHGRADRLLREEEGEYVVRPSPRGSSKDRIRFLGRYRDGERLFNYYEPRYERKGVDLDGALISELAEEFTGDGGAKDGISRDLFPLTKQQIRKYMFRLDGRERYRGREVYRISFTPKVSQFEEGGSFWAGEALVDVDKLQPVLVTTYQHKKLPLWVRTVLGTNITQHGFKVAYEEFDDDLWFPVTYGGEFKIKGLFFYNRKISISLRNSDFERAAVSSEINYDGPLE